MPGARKPLDADCGEGEGEGLLRKHMLGLTVWGGGGGVTSFQY